MGANILTSQPETLSDGSPQERRRELGGIIRSLRTERQLSTAALARACGV